MTTITYVTGASKGPGYETARRLAALGHTVIIGARDPRPGQDAADRPHHPWTEGRVPHRATTCHSSSKAGGRSPASAERTTRPEPGMPLASPATKIRDLGLCLISVRRLDGAEAGNRPQPSDTSLRGTS